MCHYENTLLATLRLKLLSLKTTKLSFEEYYEYENINNGIMKYIKKLQRSSEDLLDQKHPAFAQIQAKRKIHISSSGFDLKGAFEWQKQHFKLVTDSLTDKM
jgi:hypothetical protein